MAELVEHSLELTVSALKEGVEDLGLAGGLVEVRRWEQILEGHEEPALQDLGGLLAELRGEMESDDPSQRVVTGLLLRLAEDTLGIAALEAPGLLQSRLRELGNLLTREAHSFTPKED